MSEPLDIRQFEGPSTLTRLRGFPYGDSCGQAGHQKTRCCPADDAHDWLPRPLGVIAMLAFAGSQASAPPMGLPPPAMNRAMLMEQGNVAIPPVMCAS